MRVAERAAYAWATASLVSACLFGVGCEPALAPPSLAQALEGLRVAEPIPVVLHTTQGDVHCALRSRSAPRSVALFVGLARGRAAWRDARAGRVVRTPLYRDLAFFRAIPGALVQSGCPIGDGTGHPGYRLPVELAHDDRARLAQPGALLLARYHPAPNRSDPAPPPAGHVIGSQFVITLTDMQHLTGKVSVLGVCTDLDVVGRLAERVAAKASERLLRVSVGLPTR